jgi:hypothetical protein
VEVLNKIAYEEKRFNMEISKMKEKLVEEESSTLYKLKNDY